MALLRVKAVCWLGREVETIGVEQRRVVCINGGRHDRQDFKQFWPALLLAQWHWKMFQTWYSSPSELTYSQIRSMTTTPNQ